MVRSILQIVDSSTDKLTIPPGVELPSQALLNQQSPLSFNYTKQKLFQSVREYNNGEVPAQLACVQAVGGLGEVSNWCRYNKSYGYEPSSIRAP